MIIIRYCGGLGNQMYQYALSCVLEELYPDQTIKADTSHYELLHEHNGFELNEIFNLNIEIASLQEVRAVYAGLLPNRLIARLPYKCKKYIICQFQYKYNKLKNFVYPQKKKNIIPGLEFNVFHDVVLHLHYRENYYFDGLWQNMKYFSGYENKIASRFQFTAELSPEEQERLKEIESRNSVAVHIRGGDFLGTKFDICQPAYYQKAIRMMEEQISDMKLFVFTDDVEYAEKILPFTKEKLVYSSSVGNNYLDMLFMSKCKHNIISNSTFSFWAAFLNRNPEKIVICPKYCLNDERGFHEFSTPDNWMKIE